MAQTFCRDYMSGGVGDLNKHLGILGLKLSYVQTALDEYNFCVTSIAVELKDGAPAARPHPPWLAACPGRRFLP